MTTSRKKPASRPLRRIALIAVALVLVVGALWYWKRHEAGAVESQWRTTQVERGDIRVAISATGTLSAISTVVVGSQISGQVTAVLVDFNDKVKKGQVIARIDPGTYEAQIAQGNAQIASAQATLRQAQATLRNAQLAYQRDADLVGQQLVARSDVDLALSARDQAQAQVNAAQASIRQQTAATRATQLNLDRTVIRSPVDGVVLTRTIEPGQTVAASLQSPELFTIAEDLGKMQILLAVDESDIGQVKVGQKVSFTADAFPDRQFQGVVGQVRLSATTTSNVVTYPVVVTVDNGDGTLLPGLTVNAEIEVSKRSDVLKVSNAALRYHPANEGQLSAAAGQADATRTGGASGTTDDLAHAAAGLELDARQQGLFDQAVAAIRQRQAARRAAPSQGGRNSLFGRGGGGSPSPGGGADMQAQMRQRVQARMNQQFAAFRASLDVTQRAQWDAAVNALVGARRATLYKPMAGQPQPVTVRVGASDGTSTEISGDIKAGDEIITGERAPQ